MARRSTCFCAVPEMMKPPMPTLSPGWTRIRVEKLRGCAAGPGLGVPVGEGEGGAVAVAVGEGDGDGGTLGVGVGVGPAIQAFRIDSMMLSEPSRKPLR